MDVWIASTKNTVSNNQRYRSVRNVDFKPFPSYGNGFLFEKVTEMVTAGRYIPKNWANFSYSFKIKNSHLPLKVDMERFDFVIFLEENSYLKSTILNSNL
ncbi:TPA: hypothetical protein U1311_000920 [Streptococcus suis]|nr:hypothetical protein [Streptococcus suis]NQO21008.1 hypothetical protein [Streptococcus suis]NQP13967.1 hypothetical protein [Streptococcus suis]HEM5121939.1 hypothetical protein [Streptococcus suis]HEM5175925.1 hypothetical protein [Streptococcus suis]